MWFDKVESNSGHILRTKTYVPIESISYFEDKGGIQVWVHLKGNDLITVDGNIVPLVDQYELKVNPTRKRGIK